MATEAKPAKRRRSPVKFTAELLATIVDMLPNAESFRDIAGITGLSTCVVRREAAPFLAIMKLQGTHPKCECGKDRFHRYGCVMTNRKAVQRGYKSGAGQANNFGRVGGRWSPAREATVIARRQQFISLIVSGKTYDEIDKAMGTVSGNAKHYARFLTDRQIAARKRIERLRSRSAGEIVNFAFNDALYAKIAAVVPRHISRALREDVISDVYLAVLDNKVSVDAIALNARKFAGDAYREFEGKFSNRSLDEPMYDDSSRTMGAATFN